MRRREKVASAFSRALLANLVAVAAATTDTRNPPDTAGPKGPADLVEYAAIAPLASHSLLLDIARAGLRLVVVGERGHILHSDDLGRTWTQAARVPTRALLTAVCFFDARQGIAVGHDETILTTRDAGATWTLVHAAPERQQPLLDVWCGGGKAIAVGAYAGYFASEDDGATWHERKFEPRPLPDSDYHLNGIVAASPTRLYIAAEAGHLYRSDDGGANWITLPSPYEGSFFGLLPFNEEVVLAYGLRGHLFRSDDAGQHWHKIETNTVAMLNDAVILEKSGTAFLGLSGVVLVRLEGGDRYELSQQADRKGLSAAVRVDADTLVTVGEAGVKRIKIDMGP